ncbi:MAG: M24 family metallopeptidase [Gemmatimonadota bacterium]
MKAKLDAAFLSGAERELERAGIGGWLLYDLEARNRVAAELVGLPEGISRRWFVLIRPGHRPMALAHRIELQHWEEWEGELLPYVGWEELEALLRGALAGCASVAMEVSERDAVPFVDNVPAGVVELVTAVGARVVSSGDLLSRTYAQWGEEGVRLNREAGAVLAETARSAFLRAAVAVKNGERMTEHDLSAWIEAEMTGRGLTGGGVIVAAGANSAVPHYAPPAGGSAALRPGAVLLIDVWGRTDGLPEAVFADQTWMCVLGAETPDSFLEVWEAVRGARDGAVEFIADRYDGQTGPTGAEVDRRAREILADHGYGEHILHRTGHGMDRVNHGFGPNLDCVETREDRRLVRGIGFSVEPGVYLDGRFGVRSEINVYLSANGPEVTTPSVQREPWLVDE